LPKSSHSSKPFSQILAKKLHYFTFITFPKHFCKSGKIATVLNLYKLELISEKASTHVSGTEVTGDRVPIKLSLPTGDVGKKLCPFFSKNMSDLGKLQTRNMHTRTTRVQASVMSLLPCLVRWCVYRMPRTMKKLRRESTRKGARPVNNSLENQKQVRISFKNTRLIPLIQYVNIFFYLKSCILFDYSCDEYFENKFIIVQTVKTVGVTKIPPWAKTGLHFGEFPVLKFLLRLLPFCCFSPACACSTAQ
jgi:hypothetical protein